MNTLLIALAVVLVSLSIREWFTDTPAKDGTAKKVLNRILVIGVVIYLAVAYSHGWHGFNDAGAESYGSYAESIAFVCLVVAIGALSVTLVRRARWWISNRRHGT